jgi:hypothetical protein
MLFKSTFKSWDDLCDEAAAFATKVGKDRLINISVSQADTGGQGVIFVWYWECAGRFQPHVGACSRSSQPTIRSARTSRRSRLLNITKYSPAGIVSSTGAPGDGRSGLTCPSHKGVKGTALTNHPSRVV